MAAIAELVDLSEATIKKYCKLLQLPEPITKRLAEGRLTAKHGEILTKYVKKPEVLKAICKEIRLNPWDWTRSEQIEANALSIDRQLSAPDPDQRAEPAAHGALPERNEPVAVRVAKGDRCEPTSKKADTGAAPEKPLNRKTRTDLSADILQLLQPYRHSIDALVLIRETANRYLEQLGGAD